MDIDKDRKARWAIRGRRIILPDGIIAGSVHIQDGTITKLGEWNDIEGLTPVFDAGDHSLLPGVVDLHAHINEPGRTHWEGFESATKAAAAGGITTLADMPLNCIPPTINGDALRQKIAATRGKLWVDIAFHGGIVPGNESDLANLIRDGVVGLKCFLCDSGVEEFPAVTLGQLAAAIGRVKKLAPWILVHAESPDILKAAAESIANTSDWTYRDYLRSRPDEAECLAIRQLIAFAENLHVRIHIVHLSSAAALPLIARAKARGLAISAETCPHYLTFDAESIGNQATHLKCAPPIRSAANRENLWQGLKDGVIDIISSDHSPCAPELKTKGGFAHAWGGIASLQCSLAAVWTEARRRGFTLSDLALWMCQRPAELANLPTKGAIAIGKDADLVCFAPDETFTLKAGQILHRHKLTPYSGRHMRGVVKQTFLRGALLYNQGSCCNQPQGRVIRALRRDQWDRISVVS